MIDRSKLKKWFSVEELKRLNILLETITYADMITTRSDCRALLDGCHYDSAKGERFEKFCEQFIVQVTGRFKGKPLVLFAWQKTVFRRLFGWIRPDGTRRYKYLYLTVPKKNGKSAICAAISLFCLIADGESNAQCFLAANDRAQAGIVFNAAANYVKASPKLRKHLSIVPSTKRITFAKTYSFIQALSRETCTSDGIDASLVVYDELHLAPNREMFETLRYAGAARSQPLFIVITTAGSELDSVCGKEYQHHKKVLSGEVEDISMLPAIFEADLESDPSDPEVWRAANPSLGLTIQEDDVRDAYNQSVETGMLGNFKRRRLNIWAKDTSYWMPRDKWECLAADEFPSFEDLQDYPCWLGLDLAETMDINCLVAVWKASDSLYYTRQWFWCPEETIPVRSRETSIPYAQWAEEEWLLTSEGAVTDQDDILEFILDLSEKVMLQEIAYDPWQALASMTRLEIAGINTIKVPQTMAHLSESTKAVGRLIRNKELVHDGNPVMSWMVGNVVPIFDHNKNIRPSKKKSKEKIDGVAALVTAFARVIVADEEAELYEGTGIAVF